MKVTNPTENAELPPEFVFIAWKSFSELTVLELLEFAFYYYWKPEGSLSIATTLKCKGGRHSIP